MGTRRFDSTFQFNDLDVMIRCRACGRQKKVSGNSFRFMFDGGMPYPLGEAKRRLRCSACGHKGAHVAPVPKLDS